MKKFLTVLLCLISFIAVSTISMVLIILVLYGLSKTFLGRIVLIVFNPNGASGLWWYFDMFPAIFGTLCGFGVSNWISDKILNDDFANRVVAIIVMIFYAICLILNVIGLFTGDSKLLSVGINIIIMIICYQNIKS